MPLTQNQYYRNVHKRDYALVPLISQEYWKYVFFIVAFFLKKWSKGP